MSTPTYDLISSYTVPSYVSSYSVFLNTSLGYKDIKIVMKIRHAAAGAQTTVMQAFYGFNESSYSKDYVYMGSAGNSSPVYDRQTSQQYIRIPDIISDGYSPSTEHSLVELDLISYADATRKKNFIWRKTDGESTILGAAKQAFVQPSNHYLSFNFPSGGFIAGSTFDIYGIVG